MKIKHLTFLILSLFLMACPSQKPVEEHEDHEHDGTEDILIAEQNGLKLYELTGSPVFPEADLTLDTLRSTPTEDGAKLDFSFKVENYTLTDPTEAENHLANSHKGQHIHLIVDNGPYTAHYSPEMSSDVKNGNHVVLAFLSRSFHESLKSKGAYVLTQYKVGDEEAEVADLEAPHMFYSRPKGTYTGDDTQRILVDFYLVNTALSAEGNKVILTVDGNSSFTLSKWAPYVVEGLGMGEHTFGLQLVDADGNPLAGPFNQVERTITLQEAAAE